MTSLALKRPSGMPAFTLLWIGQLVSLTGSNMARFALALWAWETTGLATALAMMTFFTMGPTVLFSPVAGALVDRWNRKLVMALTDLGAGVASILILLLFLTGNLELWQLYILAAFSGVFEAFQFPAFSASITTMLSKEQYGRANGMLSVAESAAQVAGPVLAAFLIAFVGIGGVLFIDIVTFLIALALLVPLIVPQPAATTEGAEGKGSLRHEVVYGFRYILNRPGLLGLLATFLGINLVAMMLFTLVSPIILARTGGNEQVLGLVLGGAGLGGVAGGVLMSIWGGPRRRIHGVLLGMAGVMALGQIPFGLGQTQLFWTVTLFAASFFVPVLNASSQAIWQAKVAPDVQGRVFATRRLMAQISVPLTLLVAGPLADFVFEPAMQPGGALAGPLGGLFGTGAGAGMAVMISAAGLLGLCISFGAYLIPAIRNVERDLPEHK